MKSIAGKRNLFIGTALAALIVALGVGQSVLQYKADAQGRTVQAPMFVVDPLWPKPLPNHWLLGWTIGVWVDEQDHIWVIHRGAGGLNNNERGLELDPPISECCRTAPPILEFDQAGNLLRHWGGPGPGYEWPESNHGIFVAYKGNVWIGGNGAKDAHILKFTKDGKFLMQVGHLGGNKGSNDLENFGRVAKIWVDPKTNEAYIADGYGNKRVAVLDADTGKMKRFWGAYGNKADDLLYVCDRMNDRLQVFSPDGKFLKEAFFARRSLGEGSVWDVAFSKDPQQKYLFMSDGRNQKVRI